MSALRLKFPDVIKLWYSPKLDIIILAEIINFNIDKNEAEQKVKEKVTEAFNNTTSDYLFFISVAKQTYRTKS